ncbi:LamG-like jellyroll fold domain-containing protein [Catenovulum maritimum]|uniref:Cycloinulo-oligosaccharide fructanotransferase n=1 Tax=Catenovulum maritimum TaxID=1513271 RepID=A0A0J8JQE0_9ALTE|nr:LamG-like jellyroll fold domain-containing protein [Catenovulum maritimum]KMT66956.1 cycloinulo-oligosaccharide fructanotransferase [Catenovulum maritimum]
MNQSKSLSKEQRRLIAAYLAGEEVSDELLNECHKHPEVKQAIAKLVGTDRLIQLSLETENHQTVNSVMQRISQQQSVKQQAVKAKVIRPWFKSQMAFAASVAAIVMLFFISSFISVQNNLGVVTKVAAVSQTSELSLGKLLHKGKISLEQGYSEVVMDNGVILVLEAPIELNIRSENLVILEKGKLVAKVPPQAIGFRVDTPSSEIIDLGTEFAVDVNEQGESQVHVLDGEVKARASKQQAFKMLKKDQALAFSLDEKIKIIQSSPNLFMRALPGKSAVNPDYLHWSFDQNQAGQFASSGKGIVGQHYPAYDKTEAGQISQVAGVFANAIALDGRANWLETEFPGISGDAPRTVSFWVKVPQDIGRHEVFGIVSWGTQEFYSAWQISPNPFPQNGPIGALRIGTYNAQVVGTRDLRDGQWHHVAVVLYGGEASDISTHVLMYVDGELEKTNGKSVAKVNTKISQNNSRPLSLGRNIGYTAAHEKDKFFRGAVDELYVFDAALEQKHIRQLMKNNRFLDK